MHTYEIRLGWVPPIPRERRCPYGRKSLLRPPPAALLRPVPLPPPELIHLRRVAS